MTDGVLGVLTVPCDGAGVVNFPYFFHHRVRLRSSRSFPLISRGSGSGAPGEGTQMR